MRRLRYPVPLVTCNQSRRLTTCTTRMVVVTNPGRILRNLRSRSLRARHSIWL